MTRTLFASFALFLVCGCRSAGSDGLSVSLQYLSMNEYPMAAELCEAVSKIDIKDTRANPTVLGERFPEDSPARTSPVVAVGSTTEWLRSAVGSMARKSGVTIEQLGAPALNVEIRELSTRESVAFNSVYNARVVLAAQVSASGSNAPCWSGSAEGEGKAYGRDASPENTLERLNQAMERALSGLMNQPGFRQALCGCAPAKNGI
jgi:hypothetical protein